MSREADLLSDLNPRQREAVTHPGGPLLVVAGAGTGKTKVITRRIAWQVAQGVSPSSILALTFTNKAAGEMGARVNALVPGHGAWLSTFHSLGARILRVHADRLGYAPEFTIYDQGDKHSLVKQVLKDLALDLEQYTPSAVAEQISRAKDSLISPAALAESAGDPFSEAVSKAYRAYQERLLAQNAMDFDDLLLNLHRLWTEHPEVLEAYRQRFTQVLVDEYQDTNRVQYRLILMLAAGHRNLCATGDPDQSIYTWRGADLRNILDFVRDFPEAVTVRLEQNYRSTRNILAAASAMIARNRLRIERGLWTENAEGEKLAVWTCADERDEADRVAVEAQRLNREEGIGWGEMAVLYRQNAQSRSLEQAMLRLRIPHQIVGATAFYQRKEIKDALAYAILALNPKADVAFNRIVNAPARGLGKTSLTLLAAEAARAGEPMVAVCARAGSVSGVARRSAEAAREMAAMLQELHTLPAQPVADTLRKILERTGYLKHLGTLEPSEARERTANVLELVSAAAEYDNDHPEDGTLQGFLESVALLADADDFDENEPRVSLMTLHAVKGLEFPRIFIAGLEDGLLPHAMSKQTEEELEEERRLFYVGLTRAKQQAVLSWAQARTTYGQYQMAKPSPFLDELPPETLDGYPLAPGQASFPVYTSFPQASGRWGGKPKGKPRNEDAFDPPPHDFDDTPPLARGDLVRHPSFGEGRIEEIGGRDANARVRVRFRSGGVKTLILGFANLEKVAE